MPLRLLCLRFEIPCDSRHDLRSLRNLKDLVSQVPIQKGLSIWRADCGFFRADTEKEELRVQVNTLKFELENIKQERDVTALRHEKELRDLQFKADADFRKCQVCTRRRKRGKNDY